jgi:hypothetical protein
MFEITVIKDGQPVLVTHTDTYVLGFVDREISEPITQKMGNAALTAFLTLCLFAETVNLLAQGGTEPREDGAAAPETAKSAPAGP